MPITPCGMIIDWTPRVQRSRHPLKWKISLFLFETSQHTIEPMISTTPMSVWPWWKTLAHLNSVGTYSMTCMEAITIQSWRFQLLNPPPSTIQKDGILKKPCHNNQESSRPTWFGSSLWTLKRNHTGSLSSKYPPKKVNKSKNPSLPWWFQDCKSVRSKLYKETQIQLLSKST